MQLAQEFSGFTLGEADILRRAMGKKIASEMEEQKEPFITGAIEKGKNKRFAEGLFDQIEKFANIKHIVQKNDKDEGKIVEIFNDIKNELKTHDLELRIQELESKFAEDFNQNTFDEINRLKKEQNIN